MPELETVGDSAFLNGSLLQRLSFPKVKSVGKDAFTHCVQLTSIRLPSVKSIGTHAFWGCDRFVELYLPATPPTVGPDAFRYAFGISKRKGLKPRIIVSKGSREAYEKKMSDFPGLGLEGN